MAKGYPDFFGFSIFPQFGDYKIEINDPFLVGMDAWGTIFELTAKGKLYSGFLHITTAHSLTAIQIRFTIDGEVWTSETLPGMLTRGLSDTYAYPAVLALYNVEIGEYAWVFQQDITFASQFKVELHSSVAGAVPGWGHLHWAEVI